MLVRLNLIDRVSAEEMIFGGIIVLVICLVLIGIGIVAGVALFLLISCAILGGIVSASAAVGLLQKSFSSGVRVFSYLSWVVVFTASGMFVTFLSSMLLDLYFDWMTILSIGMAAGISVGLLFGLLSSWIIDVLIRLLKRYIPAEDLENAQKRGASRISPSNGFWTRLPGGPR